VCRSGKRSGVAAGRLAAAGVTVYNLAGMQAGRKRANRWSATTQRSAPSSSFGNGQSRASDVVDRFVSRHHHRAFRAGGRPTDRAARSGRCASAASRCSVGSVERITGAGHSRALASNSRPAAETAAAPESTVESHRAGCPTSHPGRRRAGRRSAHPYSHREQPTDCPARWWRTGGRPSAEQTALRNWASLSIAVGTPSTVTAPRTGVAARRVSSTGRSCRHRSSR
jgi:hypothetical protein